MIWLNVYNNNKRYKSGQKNSKKRVLKEIWIAQNLCGGTNIIKLYGAYLDQNTDLPTLIFEYVHAPNATNVLMWSWSEAEIRYYARELLKGRYETYDDNGVDDEDDDGDAHLDDDDDAGDHAYTMAYHLVQLKCW